MVVHLWLLSTLEVPNYPAILHGYGTIIGTGNAQLNGQYTNIRRHEYGKW